MSNVAIFWDYENCSPPSNTSGLGFHIANNISRIARLFGSVTTFRAYLDISAQSSKSVVLRSELQSSGVSMIDCPHNGRKDVVDKMILVDMLAFAVDHPTPATIILIAGDRDYAYAVSTLKLRKYQVILIVPSSPHTSPSLESQASCVIDWSAAILKTRTEALSTQPIRQPYLDLDANLVSKLMRELQDSPSDDLDTTPHSCPTTSQDTPLRRISTRDLLESSGHCKTTGSSESALDFTLDSMSPKKSTNMGSDPASAELPISKTLSCSRRPSLSPPSTRPRSVTIVAQSPAAVEHDIPVKDSLSSKSTRDITDVIGPAQQPPPVLPSLGTLELPLHDTCPPSSIIVRSPLEPGLSTDDTSALEARTVNPDIPSSHKLNCLASPFAISKPLSWPKSFANPCTNQSYKAIKPTSPIVRPTKTFPVSVSGISETPQTNVVGTPKEIELLRVLRAEGGDINSGRSIPLPVHSEARVCDTPKPNYLPSVAPHTTYSPPSGNVVPVDTPSRHVSPLAATPFGGGVDSRFAAPSRVSNTLGHSTSSPGSVLSFSDSIPFSAMASHEHDENGRQQTWTKFKPLIHLLLAAQEKGISRPSRSTIAVALVQADTQVYRRAGVLKFRDYTALAEQAGIIELGGREASAWIALHPDWFRTDGPAATHFLSNGVTSPTFDPPKVIQNPFLTDPKTPPMERTAIFHIPTFTSPKFDSHANSDTLPTSPTDRQDSASRASIPAQFQPLIDILIQTRAKGSHQALRSVVGQLLSQEVYDRAGVSGFKEYVHRASEAQLVEFWRNWGSRMDMSPSGIQDGLGLSSVRVNTHSACLSYTNV